MSEQQKSKKKYLDTVYSKYNFGTIFKYVILILLVIGVVDMINYPTQLIKEYGLGMFSFMGILVLVLFGILISEKHILDGQKLLVINIYDCIIQVMCWSSILYIFIISIFSMVRLYKVLIAGGLFIICLICTVTKGMAYAKAQREDEKYESNIIDLKKLYENQIPPAVGPIRLEEGDVDYDLLNRKATINYLVDTVLSTKPQGKFVISLEGKWGCGKTTILKNAKKMIEEADESIVIIDDFDPWRYGTEESIVENFFACIIKHNDLKMNISELKRSIRILTNAIVDSKQKTNLLYFFVLGDRDATESRNQINEYLKLCGKRVVIYIDNLDRVEDDKIVFIFKLIGNVLDFDRITYVISFDNEKVRKTFDTNLNIGYSYIKKIIQMQIAVPEIDRMTMEKVIRTCTLNLIDFYKKSDTEAREYNEFITYLAKNIKDIRDYKRVINSIVIKTLITKSNLSLRDKMIIEYIRMNNYDLYNAIYNNRKYFISQDTWYEEALYLTSVSMGDFNKKGKEFFENLFLRNSEYKKILGDLFPYVKRYNKNQVLKSKDHFRNPEEYSKIIKSRGIASAKYFDLYFSEIENQFSNLGKIIENFIKRINQPENNIRLETEKLLKETEVSLQKELFEGLQLYLSDLGSQSIYMFLCVLFDNICKTDNSLGVLVKNAYKRCNIIMWDLLQRISDDEFVKFLKYIENQYDKIEVINYISSLYEHDNEYKNIEGRKELWKKNENKIISTILLQDIDIYADKYYHLGNIWALYRNLKDKITTFENYIKKRINKKNIFRILYDALGHSISTRHNYYLSPDKLNKLFKEIELRKYMQDIIPKTADEKFLMDLYNNYLKDKDDKRSDKTSVSFNEERVLHL